MTSPLGEINELITFVAVVNSDSPPVTSLWKVLGVGHGIFQE